MNRKMLSESSTTSYSNHWKIEHTNEGLMVDMDNRMFKDKVTHKKIFDPYMLQAGRAYFIKSETNKFGNKNGEYALLVQYKEDELHFMTVRFKDELIHPFFIIVKLEDEDEWEIDRLFKE